MHLYRLMTFSVSTVFRHDELLCGRYVSRTLDPYLILSRRDVWHYEIATIIREDSAWVGTRHSEDRPQREQSVPLKD